MKRALRIASYVPIRSSGRRFSTATQKGAPESPVESNFDESFWSKYLVCPLSKRPLQ